MHLFRIKTDSLPRLLTVKVKNAEGMVFDGKAMAISSVNKAGTFDILPYHANIITIIKDKLVIYEEKNKKLSFDIQQGIIKVMSNTIYIYLGIKTVV